MTAIYLMIGFALKHFVCDFILQRAYMYRNKGVYGHPGGLMHALGHAVFTLGVLILLDPFPVTGAPLAVCALALADGFAHYHIDWAKTNINQHFGWRADTSDWFWALLGLDQLLHTLTYIAITWAVVP